MARVNLTDDVLGDDEPTRRTAPPPPLPSEKPRKFTMLVSAADDDRAHRVVDDVLRRARIRPTKSMRADVVRALFVAADEDPQLRDRLAELVRAVMPS